MRHALTEMEEVLGVAITLDVNQAIEVVTVVGTCRVRL